VSDREGWGERGGGGGREREKKTIFLCEDHEEHALAECKVMLDHRGASSSSVAVCCSVLQRVAVCCKHACIRTQVATDIGIVVTSFIAEFREMYHMFDSQKAHIRPTDPYIRPEEPYIQRVLYSKSPILNRLR